MSATSKTMNEKSINRVVELTNVERKKNGLPPLNFDNRLATAAQKHTENMAKRDFLSHTGHDDPSTSHDDSKMSERIKAEGYSFSFCAENVAGGQDTPEDVVKAWMNSDGHRKNILNPQLKDIGVGHYYLANDTGNVNYKHYWTQVFAAPQ